jgi:hypothetical protein
MIGRVHCKDYAMARTIPTTLLAAGATLGLAPALALTAGQVHAQAGFEAAYTIAVARIPIGSAAMTGSIGTDEYVISMSGRTSGLARVLANGEGSNRRRQRRQALAVALHIQEHGRRRHAGGDHDIQGRQCE